MNINSSLLLFGFDFIMLYATCFAEVPEKRNEIYILNPKKAYNICKYDLKVISVPLMHICNMSSYDNDISYIHACNRN